MKGTRGHCLKLRKTRCTRDITRHFFLIGWSTDATFWITEQSMHLAWISDVRPWPWPWGLWPWPWGLDHNLVIVELPRTVTYVMVVK